jgi:NAD(P)-dependent dehydrogenase (short-subunit alcohol dehydrogenase family)
MSTMQLVKDAVTVVTGAAQGNGKAIAKGLAQYGAKLAVCDIQLEAAQQVAAEICATGAIAKAFKVDVTDPSSVKALAESVERELGQTSILINNAGIIRRAPIDSETFEPDWRAVMAVNADGPMLMIRAFLPQLKETLGRIVNLASIMSVTAGPGLSGYAASKGALLQLTKGLAHDLAPLGIRINAIAPGVIETPMTDATRANPDAIGRFIAHTPMKRVGQPEELVGPVLFLVSNLSSYVTGTLLPVDGGYLAA